MTNYQLSSEEKIEKISEKKAQDREKRKKRKMAISGKGVFELKKIITKKS